MRTLMLAGLVLLGAAPGVALAATTQKAEEDDAAIREVVRQYVDAREQQDPKAVEALLTADVDQLVSSGEWRRGRDALVRGALASSARNPGRRTITIETIRQIGPDVALADGRYQIAQTAEGTVRQMWTTFIVVREAGHWRIAAIRNMLPAPPAEGPR